LIAAAVWLGWEIVKVPVVERSPPAIALRLDPRAPEALRRAGESELAAKRPQNAMALAEDALREKPFNARALRVRGLAEAEIGNPARADEMLTLAGNWSLRDDPAHAWLIENRLRRGDYGSAFAHADTLARRREDMYPNLFRLFTMAAIQDPKATPFLVRLLAASPPWRRAYLISLQKDDAGALLLANLALALEKTDAPFSRWELEQLYRGWTDARRFGGIREIRRRLDRPPMGAPVANGDFSTPIEDQLRPFGWRLGAAPGFSTAVFDDDQRAGDLALRVEYDSFGSGVFADQMLLLAPGSYVLRGVHRADEPLRHSASDWRITCAETEMEIAKTGHAEADIPTTKWTPFRMTITVPAKTCTAQWLWLEARPRDRRASATLWFDKISIEPVQGED
jgi:tetratricopeptide (TPR) repeat protein